MQHHDVSELVRWLDRQKIMLSHWRTDLADDRSPSACALLDEIDAHEAWLKHAVYELVSCCDEQCC